VDAKALTRNPEYGHCPRGIAHGRISDASNFAGFDTQVKAMANDKESESQRGGSGNFANDPQRASEAGKKGGEHSREGSRQQGESQNESGESRGGSGNFANDREKASEAGKQGGAHSHGGK